MKKSYHSMVVPTIVPARTRRSSLRLVLALRASSVVNAMEYSLVSHFGLPKSFRITEDISSRRGRAPLSGRYSRGLEKRGTVKRWADPYLTSDFATWAADGPLWA